METNESEVFAEFERASDTDVYSNLNLIKFDFFVF